MIENLKLSLHGIWHHKMRSALTMLGIVIGIAAIIAIVSTIKGNNEMLKESVIGANTNVVAVSLYQGDYPFDSNYQSNPAGMLPLPKEARAELEKCDGVEKVSFYRSREWSEGVVYYNNTGFSGKTVGMDDQYLDVYGYVLSQGRLLAPSEYDSCLRSCLVDTNAANALIPGEDPIGKILEIGGSPFTIVGVVKQKENNSVSITSAEEYYIYHSNDSSGKVFITESTWPIAFKFDEIQNIAVRAVNTDAMTKAGSKVAAAANELMSLGSDSTFQYKSANIQEQVEQLETMQNSTNQMLVWIAGISLLVGGIGVMNIMLVTVTERTAEIGLKKAIGAKRRQILSQFLTEAAVLTGIGGIIGVLAGILVAKIISAFTELPTAISLPAIAVAVLFSIVIGLVFGYLPARKAALLNPIDALRSE